MARALGYGWQRSHGVKGGNIVDLAAAERAIRAAVSGRPGGVYLDLPAKLFSQTMDAEAGAKSLVKVIDAAPAQIPGPDAVKRALEEFLGHMLVVGHIDQTGVTESRVDTKAKLGKVARRPTALGKDLGHR